LEPAWPELSAQDAGPKIFTRISSFWISRLQMPPSYPTSGPSEGSLDRYLREISRIPLIDREEEVRLAARARAGDSEALHDLVRANLRFVVSVAKRYQNQGVPLSDLINEGNVGLLRAASKFDETRGIKFISYAVWWIRQAIMQALAEQSRIVRIPLNRAGTMNRIGRRASALRQELGREPSLEELAGDCQLSEDEVMAALSLSRNCLSLNAPRGKDEDTELIDVLPDALAPDPDCATLDEALRRGVEGALASLPVRDAKILRLYYGLDGQDPLTLEEISELLGITRERVRQLKERALLRLRQLSRSRYLTGFEG
jgi:RNA polymerase primary sigma factor